MKEKGILLPIFSLPSKYGIGDFGYEAEEFIDILKENNIKYWEILPITACDSFPYSPVSYYAIEENYISLDKLYQYGLIDKPKYRQNTHRAIYDDGFKEAYYKEAFNRFTPNNEYYEFIKNEEIRHYAEYRSIESFKPQEFFFFIQYILYKQWMEVKTYANKNGVEIIGDLPAYPPFRSVETKYHSKYYEYVDGQYTFESGAPPDYYSDNGQKWGSPVYNIPRIKEDGYKYFLDRYSYMLTLFDKIRVDYFRGYDSFYRIPIGKSGRMGEYVPGLGYEFFDTLFSKTKVKPEDLIIEDLGDIRQQTRDLRDHYHFTRQRILQFDIDFDTLEDIDDESENVVIYPGNHDCSTIYGWYKSMSEEKQWKLKEFLRKHGCNDGNVNWGIMQYCLKCKSKIAIVQVQDLFGLDDDSRTNVPGTVTDSNWSWKLVDFVNLRERIKDFNI